MLAPSLNSAPGCLPSSIERKSMYYKSILVHVDQSRHAAQRIRLAAEIAIAEEAHLVGTAMTGISRFMVDQGMVEMNGVIVAAQLKVLHQQADAALTTFETLAKQCGVLSFESRVVDDEPEGGLALQARYCDLVVVSQPDPDEAGFGLYSDLPGYVMLNCARPVLMIPYAGRFERIGQHVLIAWDGSQQATRAITGAIGMLKRAASVAIVVFNSTKAGRNHGAEPGADIALYLSRHGIRVDVLQDETDIDIGNALLSLAADRRTDLLVMGGYGHSRFREVLLGGVTMKILDTMTLPVLMAH